MPIAKHIKSLVERLNSEIAFYNLKFEPLKSSHGYDLLSCLCGLDKYHFQQVGFVSTSLFLNVPTYQPVGWNHHIGLDQVLEQLICQKTGLNSKEHFYILGGLVAQLTMHGFKSEGECIRHPDQLVAMLRELYDTDESVLVHLDSIIELIDSLEYVDSNKKKSLHTALYWILHWCYAVLAKHEVMIKKEIQANNKIHAKQQALLMVYQPYFERAQAKVEKYYIFCVEQNFDQALSFSEQFKGVRFISSYDKTHAFTISNQEYEPQLWSSRKTSNLFYAIEDIHIGEYETWNSFYRLMNEAEREAETDEENIILILLQRLFRKDALGRDDTGMDFVVINKYQYLFSDEFEQELKQRFPLLTERGKQPQLEQKALSIYSQMYRHYLKHKNFDDYQLPHLVEIKATE